MTDRNAKHTPDGLAFAKRYLEIALEVTSKGTSARPTVKHLNELYEMARAIERKATGGEG